MLRMSSGFQNFGFSISLSLVEDSARVPDQKYYPQIKITEDFNHSLQMWESDGFDSRNIGTAHLRSQIRVDFRARSTALYHIILLH